MYIVDSIIIAAILLTYCWFGIIPVTSERPKKEWFRQIYTEAERMEKLYPEYLTASLISKSDFSEHAVQILKLLDEGMTMKQISEALFLSESTVKYHTVESYRKLGAKGKLDALRKARALEII